MSKAVIIKIVMNVRLWKIPSFHLISSCENFVEGHSFSIVLGELPELWGNCDFSQLGKITVFLTV